MLTIKTSCYKGTRILVGNDKRELIQEMIQYLYEQDFMEIQIPIIQFEKTFKDKVGDENNNLMYTLSDRGGRELCLAPEYTSVVQQLSNTDFKDEEDVKLFYVAECFRGEKPQRGRYRQFTQFGVEILNPSNIDNIFKEVIDIARDLVSMVFKSDEFNINTDVKRGLDYYSYGFEIQVPELGTASQICGGGIYEGGIGFALGIDRMLNKV